jgi:hypothetical protein
MSVNWKRVWCAVCVECGRKAPLVDAEHRRDVAEKLLAFHHWTFPAHEPHCPKHSKAASDGKGERG